MLYNSKNPHGGDIYGGGIRLDFSANTNPLGTPQSVIDAARASLEFTDRYPDPYARELISSIAGYHGVPEDYVLAGAGAAEMIYSYCLAGRFRRAMMAAPTFSEYELGLKSVGTADVAYHTLSESENFKLNNSIIDSIKRYKPDAVFICNPNNPTGRLADPELMLDLVTLTDKLGIRLFVDECFIELAGARLGGHEAAAECKYPGVTFERQEADGDVSELASTGAVSLVSELEGHSNLTILRAFTKNYGMAGLRLGYVLSSDPELLTSMAKRVQPWNLSTPAQAAGVQAIKETEFLKESIRIIKEEREYLTANLRELGLMVIDSDVNYLLFRGPGDLWERMRDEGILIRNCDNYVGLERGWFRIAVKLHEENEELLRAMIKVLQKAEQHSDR